MGSESLKALVIEHLRGAVSPFTLTFEKGKKLSVIYGENGTGKSTICDAFDFLGNGNVGSLDNRGLGTTKKFWHSLGKSPADVSVRLETSAGHCTAMVGGKSGAIIDSPEKRPRVEVLRRSQILSLVEATASERYGAIRQFIDVSGIENSEETLRKLIRSIEGDLSVAVARVQENRETIGRFWDQAGRPGVSALPWAKAEVAKDQSQIDAAKLAVDLLKTSFNTLTAYPDQYQSLMDVYNAAFNVCQEAQNSVAELTEKAAGEYLEIFDMLTAAQAFFAKHPKPDACPLCESAENAATLPEKVKSRIESQTIANQLKAAQEALSTKQYALNVQQQRVDDLKESAVADAEKFTQATQGENLPPSVELPPLPTPAELSNWGEWLASSAPLLEQWGKISDGYTENRKFVATLKASLDALDNNSQIQHDLDVVLPRLKQTLAVMENERHKFTDAILHQIAGEVGRLYEQVHPGEGLNKISLELDPAKRASLEIATEFRGQDGTPPQAYFSDSHLDTLGLCVFLALAKMDKPEEKILVLDDVLGSVDEPHVDRLIEMLYEEAMIFRQCIITTHYKPWKQKFRWGWLKHGQCQFVELGKWDGWQGLSLTKSIPDLERLRTLLTEMPPDPQLVCAKAGVILEAALDFLTQLYECHVPRRNNSLYTLGDLLPAVDKKLRAVLRVEHRHEAQDGTVTYIEKQLTPHLEEISRIAQVRNVFGCHFNALSFDMLDTDAIKFGQEVLALMDNLIDHEAGWPRSDKSGSYWATSGETRRLHPLKKPS